MKASNSHDLPSLQSQDIKDSTNRLSAYAYHGEQDQDPESASDDETFEI